MDLVYIERNTTDLGLVRLLDARAKAAERCTLAAQHAADVKAAIIRHVADRLAAGVDASALRRALMDGGIHPNLAGEMVRMAGADGR